MIYNKEELREIQLKETEILKEFIRVADELNCTYFLEGGTLLGCIRHKGFIPWDDDVDVNMPRKDYEVFLREAPKYLKSKYFLQTNSTDPEFTWNYAKIRDSETTFIETLHKDSNINHGLYIDIFPIDGYRRKNKIREILLKIKKIMLNIQISKYRYIPKEEKSIVGKVKTVIKNIVLLLPSNIIYGRKNLSQLIEKWDNIATEYNYEDCEYVYICMDPSHKYDSIINRKEIFTDFITKEFEGINAKIPIGWDEYLTNYYGNYMELPPEEDRIPKHDIVKLDLNNTYRDYIKQS